MTNSRDLISPTSQKVSNVAQQNETSDNPLFSSFAAVSPAVANLNFDRAENMTQNIANRTAQADSLSQKSRYLGAMLGVAIGDALGTSVNFPGYHHLRDMVGGGPFRLKPGEWTDDTALTLCVAESLLESNGFDATNQLEYYANWFTKGYNSCRPYAFDIGGTIRRAVKAYLATGKVTPYPQGTGNGSLMRLAPVVLAYAANPFQAIEVAGQMSETTHGDLRASDACRYYAGLILGALAGKSKEELLTPLFHPTLGTWAEGSLHPEIEEIALGSFKLKEPPQIKGSGYVVSTLEAVLWAFYYSKTFKHGVLKLVNIGDDADSTGAVYGSLAGAYYGYEALPPSWVEKIAKRRKIEQLAGKLLTLSATVITPLG